MAGSFNFDVNKPQTPQAPVGRGRRVSESGNESKPAAFRAWVTTRILGEAFRSALTNGPKKRQESPFSKYLGEARDSLSKLRNLGLPQEPPAPDFKLPTRPLARFDAKVNLVSTGLREKPVAASPVHLEKPGQPVLQDFQTPGSQKTPSSPLKPKDPGEAGGQTPRPQMVWVRLLSDMHAKADDRYVN